MTISVSRGLTAAITLTLGLGLLSGCAGRAPGELGESQAIFATCPKDKPVSSFMLGDGTASGDSEAIVSERLQAIEKVVRRTAICGGHATVALFSTGSSATVTILNRDLVLPGATVNSRLRQVPKLVESVMTEVTAAYGPALAQLPGGGTDVTGMYRLLGEQAAQFPDAHLEAYLLTDGLDTGLTIDHALTEDEAAAIAEQVSVPALPGASVTTVGLGRVAGDPVPSDVVDGLVNVYDALCARSGAAECLSLSDWR